MLSQGGPADHQSFRTLKVPDRSPSYLDMLSEPLNLSRKKQKEKQKRVLKKPYRIQTHNLQTNRSNTTTATATTPIVPLGTQPQDQSALPTPLLSTSSTNLTKTILDITNKALSLMIKDKSGSSAIMPKRSGRSNRKTYRSNTYYKTTNCDNSHLLVNNS